MRIRSSLAVAAAVVLAATLLVACSSKPDRLDESDEPSFAPTGPCEVQPENGDVVHTLTVDGRERQYRLFVPEDLPTDTRVPVVYVLHGSGQQPADAVAYSAFDDAAKEHGFIVVAPLGREAGPAWDVDSPQSRRGSDLSYMSALTDAVVQRHCGDPERQYATGLSGGSAMVFEMACAGTFPFAAYGGVAYITFEGCDAAPPTNFIYFHGTFDEAVPYAGGRTPIGVAPPVTEALQQWVTHDGCGEPTDYDEPAADIQQFTWTCPEASIEAFVVLGGGHTWPGATGAGGVGPTTTSIQATAEMVRFFGLADDG